MYKERCDNLFIQSFFRSANVKVHHHYAGLLSCLMSMLDYELFVVAKKGFPLYDFNYTYKCPNYHGCVQFDNFRNREPAPSTKKDVTSSEDEYDKAERDREADLKERDEFAKRLLDKDKDKQRQIMSKSEKKVRILLLSVWRNLCYTVWQLELALYVNYKM